MADHDERADPTAMLATVVAAGGDLEQLTRTILEILGRATGLESTYLTVIDWERSQQEVLFAENAGDLTIPEGTIADWGETLCRRALLTGTHATDNVALAFGEDNGGHELGIVSYASVPVITADNAIFGTLCAASASGHELSQDQRQLMELFARLIGDHVTRERTLVEERRRAIAADDRSRARTLLIAESEHRVKTPLTVILGATMTLVEHWDELPEADLRDMAGAILRHAEDLARCIEVLLAQARNEMDVLALSPRAVSLGPELQRLAIDYSLISKRHPVTASCPRPVVVRADPVALRQVIGHLIDNAIKYTPDGSAIELTGDIVGESAVISVVDHGAGLPVGNLFAAFERGEQVRGQTGGSGLGLHIVRGLVEGMDGTVEARQGEGGGTVFVIALPGI